MTACLRRPGKRASCPHNDRDQGGMGGARVWVGQGWGMGMRAATPRFYGTFQSRGDEKNVWLPACTYNLKYMASRSNDFLTAHARYPEAKAKGRSHKRLKWKNSARAREIEYHRECGLHFRTLVFVRETIPTALVLVIGHSSGEASTLAG